MLKKVYEIVIMLTLVFTLISCQTDFNFAHYKIAASIEIESYVSQCDYSLSNWSTICEIVTATKVEIHMAEDKSGVDLSLKNAKETIDRIPKENLNLKWDNENAVYVYIKAGFEKEIAQNVDASFKDLSYQRVYITEKNVNTTNPLVLMFILEQNNPLKQQEFINLLEQDSRVSYARNCRDLQFDTIDERYIDKQKSEISVGETLLLELKGAGADYYVEPFDFEGLLIKPTLNITYTIDDFPIQLSSLDVIGNGWLYLKLATAGYFNVIKAIDNLSRLSMIDKIMVNISEISLIPPSVWEKSSEGIVSFESPISDSAILIKGIKPGSVIVSRDGINCEIVVR